MKNQMEDLMLKAFNLGQTYWQQADSESTGQWRKADVTLATFEALLDKTADQMREYAKKAVEAEKAKQQKRIDDLEKAIADWQQRYAAQMHSIPSTGVDSDGYRRW